MKDNESKLHRLLFRHRRRKHFKRKYHRSRAFNTALHTKDFALRKRQVLLPQHNRTSEKNFKSQAKIAAGLILSLATLALLIYHPFFHITTVSIEGLKRISEDEMHDSIRGIIDYNIFFVFPRNNFFLVDVTEIKDVLLNKFPLSSIRVVKLFPHTLTISVEEKLSTLIYDNGIQYSYLGINGHIVEQIRLVGDDEWKKVFTNVTSTNNEGEVITQEKLINQYHIPSTASVYQQAGEYPILYDITATDKHVEVNSEVIKPLFAEHIVEWYNLLQQTNISFQYIQLENILGDAYIHTGQRWGIRVDLSHDTKAQFNAFIYILEHEISGNSPTEYVDVRFADRAYWK